MRRATIHHLRDSGFLMIYTVFSSLEWRLRRRCVFFNAWITGRVWYRVYLAFLLLDWLGGTNLPGKKQKKQNPALMFPLTKTAGLAISQSHARVLCVCVCVWSCFCALEENKGKKTVFASLLLNWTATFFFFFFLLGTIFVVWPASYVPYVLV